MELGAFEQALEVLDGLVEKGVPEDVLLPVRAECLRALSRFAEAVPFYERLLGSGERKREVLLALAWCHKRVARPDLAAKDMEQLLAEEPKSPIGHYNLACYLSLAGEPARCLLELRAALELDPGYASAVPAEKDFDAVREDPEFQRLLRWGTEEMRRRKKGETP